MAGIDSSETRALPDEITADCTEMRELTQSLSETMAVIKPPPPFANTRGLSRHEIGQFRDRRPSWAWYRLTVGGQVGHHPGALIHSREYKLSRGC